MTSARQNISLLLPGSIPFGFKMQGGKEYRAPLTILSVSSGGKAHVQGLKTGDVLMEINSTVTHNLDHTTAMKHIKSTKEGLRLVLTRGAMTNEGGLQAMKEYSESHDQPHVRADSISGIPPLARADSISGIPPPVRADSVSGLPPPPSEFDLPPPPLDEMSELPPPPPAEDTPPISILPPAPTIPPPAPTPPSPPVPPTSSTPPSKPFRKPSVPRMSPPQGSLQVHTSPATLPADLSFRADLDMPKSNLSKFGSAVTEIAANKEGPGVPNEPKRESLDSWMAKLAAGDPTNDNPKPSTNKSGAANEVLASDSMDPGSEATTLRPPDNAPSGGFSLASMAYNPGTSPAKSPQMPRSPNPRSPNPRSPNPRSPTPRKLVAPSSLTSNTQDIKKKFDAVDLNENKFRNKGSFYSQFPPSPTTPPVSPDTKSLVATPVAVVNTPPASAAPPVKPRVKPEGSGVKYSAVPTAFKAAPDTSPGKGSSALVSTGRQAPVRPPVRPITPPPEEVEHCHIHPLPVAAKPPATSHSTCASPLPGNKLNPAPTFNQTKVGEKRHAPIRPKMVPLVDAPQYAPRISNLMSSKSPTVNSPDRNYAKPASPKSTERVYPKSPSPNTQDSLTKEQTPATATNGGVVLGGKPLFAPKNNLLPICKACHQEIRGAYVGAQGRAWHAEHFICGGCNGDLSQGFKEVEDELFCGPCYFDKFGEKCVNCGQAVAGPVIQALGKSYHPEHFTCAQCDTVLSDGFNVDNGQPYCNSCHTNFLPDCAGCGEKIEGAAKWISALEKDWHNGCFTCHVCKAPLAGKTFCHEAGKALCQLHANAARNNA